VKERYISLREAGIKLGVVRGTLRYYMKRLDIESIKFPLDKRGYIKLEDFERMMRYKEEALERSKESTDPKLPTVEEAA